jgi:hypothetical protein
MDINQMKDVELKINKWLIDLEGNKLIDKYALLLIGNSGIGKCHGYDTPIIMYDGTIKMVQDIIPGDQLMGDDSTSRTVLGLGRGIDEMYEISNVKGDKYTVNSEHLLCLKYSSIPSIVHCADRKRYQVRWFDNKLIKKMYKTFSYKNGNKETKYKNAQNYIDNIMKKYNNEIIISVKNYLKLPKSIKNNLNGYKTGITFPEKKNDIDPYLLGVWLGDGTAGDLDHIPSEYKCNSRENQLKLLAGLIDVDGYYNKTNNIYEIMQKNNTISNDIVFLARSLGFVCHSKKCKKIRMYNNETREEIYNITIYGNGLDEIPVLCPQKIGKPLHQINDPLVSGITVKSIGKDKYYGFELDGNHKYLLGNFTVTHNTRIVKKVLSERSYYTHIINTNNYKDKKILKALMENIINSKQGVITGHKKHAILIDDLDGISINDRGSITEIIEVIKYITQRSKKQGIPPLPIVCISNHSYLKKKKDLIKLCNLCKIEVNIGHKIREKITEWMLKNDLNISSLVIDKIVVESQNDFHRLNNILLYIEISNCKDINELFLSELLENIEQKTITKHLYDSCKYLLTDNISVHESLLLFKQERTLLPLMMHENFNNYIPADDKYTRMLILQSLSKSMIIETLLYNKNEWDLQNIYSFRSCFLPSYLIDKSKKRNIKIDYTMLLNKTSLRHTYIHKYRQKLMVKPNVELYFDRKNMINILDEHSDDNLEEYQEKYGWDLKDIQALKKIL